MAHQISLCYQKEQCHQKSQGQICNYDVECESLRCVNKICRNKLEPRFLRRGGGGGGFRGASFSRSSTSSSRISTVIIARGYGDYYDYYYYDTYYSYTADTNSTSIIVGILVPLLTVGFCIGYCCIVKMRQRQAIALQQSQLGQNMQIEASINNNFGVEQVIGNEQQQDQPQPILYDQIMVAAPDYQQASPMVYPQQQPEMMQQPPMLYPVIDLATGMHSHPVMYLPTTLSTEQDQFLGKDYIKLTDIPTGSPPTLPQAQDIQQQEKAIDDEKNLESIKSNY